MPLCAAGLLLLLGAGPSPDRQAPIPDLSQRINAFSLDLLKQHAAVTGAPINAGLSPQSVFQGLTMSYVASGGQTRKELAEVFHFPDDNQHLLSELNNLRRQINTTARQRRLELKLANSLWLDAAYADFRKDYVGAVQSAFAAPLHRVSFAQRNQVSRAINAWIAEATRGRIRQSVSSGDFEPKQWLERPGLASVNAAYFKADWGQPIRSGGNSQVAIPCGWLKYGRDHDDASTLAAPL